MLTWTTSGVLQKFLDRMQESQGDASVLEELFKKYSIDVNAYDSSGLTLLHHAAMLGYDDSIYVLFQYGANLNQLTVTNKSVAAVASEAGFENTAQFVSTLCEENNAFLTAIQNRDLEYIKAHDKCPDCKFYRTANGLFPLHYACNLAAYEIVNELLSVGFDPNQPDSFGRTPLHWAALLLDWDLFSTLISHGSDLQARSLTGKTPVCLCYHFLKDTPSSDFSSLCDASFFDAIDRLDLESCESYLDSRPADYVLQLVDAEGNSPLHYAVRDREAISAIDLSLQADVVRLFLQQGFDPRRANAQGLSPWDLAQQNPYPEIRKVVEAAMAAGITPETTPEAAHEPMPQGSSEASPAETGERRCLWPSSRVQELLEVAGLEEYGELFDSNGYVYCHDLYALSEDDFKTMGVKFGHRKRLVELLGDSDCLRKFLDRIGLSEREEALRELGFESVWSLLGVDAAYTEKMGLTEDEMRRWLVEKEGLTAPPIPSVRNDESCENLLRLIFSEAETRRIMADGAVDTVNVLLFFKMSDQEELKIRFGEAVGISYLVMVGRGESSG